MGQPFAGHQTPVAQRIKALVIDGRDWLKVQDNDRDACFLHHGQHRRAEGIRRDIQKDNVHIRAPEYVRRFPRFLWRVHHAGVDDFDTRPFQMRVYLLLVALKPG